MIRTVLIFLALLLGCAGYFYKNPQSFIRLKDTFERRQAQMSQQDTLLSLSYVLPDEGWLEFQIPQATNRLRIITNVIVPAESYRESDLIDYSLRYQLYDDANGGLPESDYHFHTKITFYSNSADSKKQPSVFLPEQDKLPTDGRVLQLDLSQSTEASGNRRIRIKQESLAAPGTAILSRVYARKHSALLKDQTDWARLQSSKRKKLAQGNIYPYDLLNSVEIKNIMQNQWLPIGPAGIPGKDFSVRKMYVRRDISENSPVSQAETPVTLVGPGRLVTWPLPEEGKNLLLRFTPVAKEAGQPPGKIQVRWSGKRLNQERKWEIELNDTTQDLQNSFGGGILEISSTTAASLSVLDPDNEMQAIPPSSLLARMYPLSCAEPLDFKVRHVDGTPTPLRINVRSFDPVTLPQSVSLRYHLLDKNNKHIDQIDTTLHFTPTPYDRIVSSEHPLLLSEPEVFYLMADPSVTAIRFEGSVPVMVSVANRPPRYRREIQIPESSFPTNDVASTPSWFSYPPHQEDTQSLQSDSFLLHLQARPPSRNQQVLDGDYHWEGFRPNGGWRGSFILIPQEEDTSQRLEALGSTFHEIYPEVPLHAEFESFGFISPFRPQLAFIRDEGSPVELAIQCDGNAWFRKEIVGRRGVISLAPLNTGVHNVKLATTDYGRFFLSNILDTSNSRLLRFVYKLPAEGLQFTIEKRHSTELLSFFYSLPPDFLGRARLRVDLQGQRTANGPFSGLTLRKRLYDIRPGGPPLFPVMNTADHWTDSGQQFFFPLEADLPEGKYLLTLQPEDAQNGYITMSRITPGKYDWGYFFREAVR